MKIAILGAFDRHNYGDILFPIILEKKIKTIHSEVEIEFFSLSSSDMTYCGGYKTKPINELINSDYNFDAVALAGGDLLSSYWYVMHSHVIKSKFAIFFIKSLKRLMGQENIDYLVACLYKVKTKMPYVISKGDIKNTPIKLIYNCVGGSGLGKLSGAYFRNVVDALRSADFVSGRDQELVDMLNKNNVNAKIIPDSALIMSDYFKFKNNESEEYIVFQAANDYAKNDIGLIVAQLHELSEKYKIVLLPIGKANGHEDDIVLQKIYDLLILKSSNIELIKSDHVLDIMRTIAGASCYIGTSLHGAITSMSYSVPVCAIYTQRVKKLKDYNITWNNAAINVESGDFLIKAKELADKKITLPNHVVQWQKQLIHSFLHSSFSPGQPHE